VKSLHIALFGAFLFGCSSSSTPPQRPAQNYPPQQPYGQAPQPGYYPQSQQPTYPQQGYAPYPQQPYAPPQYAPAPQQPAPQAPAPAAQRPLLAPLVGVQAWQAEVRNVLAELIASLSPDKQVKVRGIPLVFDPSFEVNAFAGCDDNGAPFLAGTAGILETIDAIAQTRATDELFGTQTYVAYANAVIPQMLQTQNARAALPNGIIPVQYAGDARRLSRARELFDEIVAFTFGHELAHHYLGHTGCANGQAMGAGPNPAQLGHLVTRVLPWTNQINEGLSDTAGVINALDAGRGRRPNYSWTENGGLMLLNFFARVDSAAQGTIASPLDLLKVTLNGFSRTHPNSAIRIPIIQQTAQQWWRTHPG